MNPVEIECTRCLLRRVVPDDAASLARHGNDRDVWLSLRDRFPHPYTVEHGRQWIAHVLTQPVQTGFAIVVEGTAVGSIGLVPGDDISSRSAEIGYWIGREYWGRGIMPDAVHATTRYAFETLGMLRVFAVPYARTTRSARVLEKAGYTYEGLMRRSAVKDGEILDQLLYAATDDRYER